MGLDGDRNDLQWAWRRGLAAVWAVAPLRCVVVCLFACLALPCKNCDEKAAKKGSIGKMRVILTVIRSLKVSVSQGLSLRQIDSVERGETVDQPLLSFIEPCFTKSVPEILPK